MTVVAIIPARFTASRLPGKPLADIGGKPMIQRVYEQVAKARVDRVLAATDDPRIAEVVRAFGGEAVLTDPNHPSGTDRVAEAARELDAEIIINVQGDEPLIAPETLDIAAAPLLNDAAIPMATLAHPLTDAADLINPDVVKVVSDQKGFALYFSRWPIPYDRDSFGATAPSVSEDILNNGGVPSGVMRHIGLYVYRNDFLQKFAALAPTPLERLEKLEQLRALEHGFRIRVVPTDHAPIGVDTPGDLERVRALFNNPEMT